MKPAIYLLFCTTTKEAKAIREVLLEKRLIGCGGIIKIDNSKYWWEKTLHQAHGEILMILESKEENFAKIEKEVRKLHAHKTFVLLSIPVSTTQDVKKWLKDELK